MSPGAWWMLGITWSAVIGISVYLFARLLRRPGPPGDGR
jgi:membrane protein implicated in regulation of membrane protease activity